MSRIVGFAGLVLAVALLCNGCPGSGPLVIEGGTTPGSSSGDIGVGNPGLTGGGGGSVVPTPPPSSGGGTDSGGDADSGDTGGDSGGGDDTTDGGADDDGGAADDDASDDTAAPLPEGTYSLQSITTGDLACIEVAGNSVLAYFEDCRDTWDVYNSDSTADPPDFVYTFNARIISDDDRTVELRVRPEREPDGAWIGRLLIGRLGDPLPDTDWTVRIQPG